MSKHDECDHDFEGIDPQILANITGQVEHLHVFEAAVHLGMAFIATCGLAPRPDGSTPFELAKLTLDLAAEALENSGLTLHSKTRPKGS